jgi:hypothetical protein
MRIGRIIDPKSEPFVQPPGWVVAQNLKADRRPRGFGVGDYTLEQSGADSTALVVGIDLDVIDEEMIMALARPERSDRRSVQLNHEAAGSGPGLRTMGDRRTNT